MRRLLLGILVVLLAVPGPALAAPHTDVPMVDAIVVLRSQADLGPARSGSRAHRVTAVVHTLRDHATRAQRGVVGLLAARRRQGLVSDVTPLWVEDAVAVRATPRVLAELAARPDVREIQPNRTVDAPPTTAGTAENLDVIGASAMWDMGFRGQGVVVANLDTGVDVTHPDLAGSWRGGTNSWYDPNGQHPTTPTDVNGHGTQTMGVMVGGSTSGTTVGVAPAARWIAAKIFNDRGSATSTGIHLAFQWLLDPDRDPATADAPNVVNASWTMSTPSCVLDFQPDLRSLRAAGILPVFAAGNYGPSAGTVYSPANLPEAFAVGGTDNAGVLDTYSSRGPSACAGAAAPRLVAPGVGIPTTDLYGLYISDSGTSVAAPHVAGALALLLGAFPQLSAEQQEAALTSTAADLGASGVDGDFGYGRLDVPAAYQWLATTPDFSLAASPPAASGPASYTVSVINRNAFAGDVALSVSGLPDGQTSFDPPTVLGDGTAQLTVTPAVSLPPGTYPLTITGTSGTLTRTTSVTVVVPKPPDFSLVATPATRTVTAGGTGTYTATVGALNGFTDTVGLSLSGLPETVGTAAFSEPAVPVAGNSQLTITTATTAPAGSYPLTITGASGATTHTATVTLVVPVQDFTLSASPSTATVTRGQTATYMVSTTATGPFTATVTLSSTGTPAGATPTFIPNQIATPGSSTFRVSTTSGTPRGTYTVTITGTGGGRTHQRAITMTVR
jgi:subtilisin family serine protease